MESILHGLNEAQQCAVTSPAAVLQVLAPPGSGKTKTLTSRVGYLIANNGFEPRNIIVCTFTVKSAREMQDRIAAFLGKHVAGKLILGTFHSISRRYLAAYGSHIGLDEKFGIADSSDTLSIITRIIKRNRFNIQPAQARARISSLKSQGVDANHFAHTSKKADQQEIAITYTEYEEHLHVSNLLDFDDLLVRCVELLRRFPSCVANIDALLIDEFQDTNNIQYDLMQLFAQHEQRITIVGDPDQSIYGWRNAEIRNLKKMQQAYPDTCVVKLEENYRSSGAILLSAQEVIEQDQSRPSKRLMPTHSVGLRPVLRKLPNAAAEAAWLVSEIKRTSTLAGGLLKYSDFSVLLRSASLSRHIESALGKEGIPYRMVGGHKFFDRIEVKLALDYLRVLNHPDHNDALARIINVPSRKIGEVTIQRLLEDAAERKVTLWTLVLGLAQGNIKPKVPLSPQSQKGVEAFINLMLNARKKLHDSLGEMMSLDDFLAYIINKINLDEYLKKTKAEEYDARWANVQELVAQAADYSATARQEAGDNLLDGIDDLQGAETRQSLSTDNLLSGFLANVALSTEVQKGDDEQQPAEQVTISTIHAAKGLEWPVVFIPATYDGSIPHSRAEDTDEERRLLYVAMTRAQSLLYLSHPNKNSMGERTTMSPFLSEKPMESYFETSGPTFGFTVIAELASILRRTVPDRSKIEKAALEIERKEDDLWPLDGENVVNPEARSVHWQRRGMHEEQTSFHRGSMHGLSTGPCRRPETLQQPDSHTIFRSRSTMDAQSEMLISSATLNTTFMSAATALATLHQTDLNADRRDKRSSSQQDSSAGKKQKLGQEATRKFGQQSLSGFLLTAGPKPSAASPSSPKSRAGGPNNLPSSREAGQVTRPGKPCQQERSDLLHAPKPSSPRDTKLNNASSICDVPAPTMHRTSIQKLNATSQRKTLGVRRSLNGWGARSAQR